MRRDQANRAPLIRRTGLSALALVVAWAVSKLLDLGATSLWRSLSRLGGWPLALAGVTAVGLMISLLFGILAGRIRLPGQRIRIWVLWLARHAPYALRDLAHRRRVGDGSENPRWKTRDQFEIEDERRVGSPDQLQTDFGHWRDHRRGGIRVSFIHRTGEVVAVNLSCDDQPVELLGHARDEHHAAQLLKGYECVHELRWARYRLHGWRVPVPPDAQWWYEFDRRSPRPWPTPPPPSVGRTVGAYYGQCGDDLDCVVEIVDEAGRRPLYHAVDSSPTGLAWGYGGAGPTDLSRSMLLDRLGYVPQPRVVYAFRDEVVAKLDEQFVLKFQEIDVWIFQHGPLFAKDPRADPLDPYAAGGAYDRS